jgi:lysozyme
MTDRLLDTLANEEGFRPYVYDDATGEPIVPGYTCIGHPTIWYGLCLEKGRVPKLPIGMPREALQYVSQGKYGDLVNRAPWIIGQPDDVRLALALMAYQLGASGVLGFKRMCAALQRGDREAAADEALDSEWHRKDSPARARRVAELIRGTAA